MGITMKKRERNVKYMLLSEFGFKKNEFKSGKSKKIANKIISKKR